MTLSPAVNPAANAAAEEGFYVDDVAFQSGFVLEQTPLLIATAAALGGFVPPTVQGAFRYCDLGCGDGTTLCALAALNPQAEFVGIDFNAQHVASGQAQAKTLGLGNLSFRQASFTDLEAHGDLGSFELVSCNGIYSWLEEAPRQGVITFLQRHLKPGGLFYVEFTSLPGMAAVPPLWHLIQTLEPLAGRNSRERAKAGLERLQQLARRGLAFLSANPRAAGAARHYLSRYKQDPEATIDHFIHNAMASGFRPRYFDAMAAEMAEADLQFAGRTVLPLNDIELAVPPTQVPTFRDLADPIQRQLLVDYVRNEQNRRDVFIKQAEPNPAGAAAFLGQQLRLLARNAADAIKPVLPVPGGRSGLPLRGPIYESLLPAFEAAARPAASVELPSDLDPALIAKAIARLTVSPYYFHLLPGAESVVVADPDALAARQPRLPLAANRWLLDQAAEGFSGCQLGSPLTGGAAIQLSVLEVLLLRHALDQGWDGAAKAVASQLAEQDKRMIPTPQGGVAANSIKDDQLQELLTLLKGRKLLNMARLGIIA